MQPLRKSFSADQTFEIFLVAVAPPEIDGLELLRLAHRGDSSLPVILIADQPTVELLTAGLRLGADDFLARGRLDADLLTAISRLLERRQLGAENELLRRQIEKPYSLDDFIGTSSAMQKVFSTIDRIADSNVDVLVLGETGTGKELIARAIHRRSPRRLRHSFP